MMRMPESDESREPLLSRLDASELIALARSITKGERISGSLIEAAALDDAAAYLARHGIEVRRYDYTSLVGFPHTGRVRVLAPEPMEFACTGYALHPETGADAIEAELVRVVGDLDGSVGPESTGRIGLFDGMGSSRRSLVLDESDLLAGICIQEDTLHQLCVSPVRGTPTPRTRALLPRKPMVGIARQDGRRLRQLLDAGPVLISLENHATTEWRSIPVLVGDIRVPDQDGFVLLSSHVDSWHDGGVDNATGNAAVLAIARILSERRTDLVRGVRVAFWSGHSHARYAGSAWYADDQWPELSSNCVAHVEIDSIGAVGADVVELAPTMAETYALGARAVAKATGATLRYNRVENAGDMPAFWGMGVPSLFGNFSFQRARAGRDEPHGGYGPWWHSVDDTTDRIDPARLLRDTRAHAIAVWELATSPILPLQYSAAAREIRNAVAGFARLGNPDVDLRHLLVRCEELVSRVEALEAAVARSSGSDPARRTANRALRALGRALIPANYKSVDAHEHDLALPAGAVPGLAVLATMTPGSESYWFEVAEALRQRNRIGGLVDDAIRVANEAEQELG